MLTQFSMPTNAVSQAFTVSVNNITILPLNVMLDKKETPKISYNKYIVHFKKLHCSPTTLNASF